jgi:hypothetical protein
LDVTSLHHTDAGINNIPHNTHTTHAYLHYS